MSIRKKSEYWSNIFNVLSPYKYLFVRRTQFKKRTEIEMHRSMIFILVYFSMIINAHSFRCSCSCCAGLGCSFGHLGTVSVRSCASTTCLDACKAAYTPCAVGLTNVVCLATNVFHFYSNLILILLTCIFILFNKT